MCEAETKTVYISDENNAKPFLGQCSRQSSYDCVLCKVQTHCGQESSVCSTWEGKSKGIGGIKSSCSGWEGGIGLLSVATQCEAVNDCYSSFYRILVMPLLWSNHWGLRSWKRINGILGKSSIFKLGSSFVKTYQRNPREIQSSHVQHHVYWSNCVKKRFWLIDHIHWFMPSYTYTQWNALDKVPISKFREIQSWIGLLTSGSWFAFGSCVHFHSWFSSTITENSHEPRAFTSRRL